MVVNLAPQSTPRSPALGRAHVSKYGKSLGALWPRAGDSKRTAAARPRTVAWLLLDCLAGSLSPS